MSNDCKYDCKYCTNCGGKNKVEFKPDELAKVFDHLKKQLNLNGLFLSSGITSDADTTTEKMIEAVKLVRNKYNFNGYVHFKVIPGTSYELIKQASELSSRMSVNLEAPNKQTLDEFSSCKDFKSDILRRQAWVKRMGLPAGQSTQVIVSEHSTDKDIVKMVDWQYNKMQLKRFYFSAFQPVKGTAFENVKAEPLSRQNHLYNVDFLLRKYQFKTKELFSIMDDGMLPNKDPKLALALQNYDGALDINEASYSELLRIPGIGPTTAMKLVKSKVKKMEDFFKLGGHLKRAAPFISINGKRQASLAEFAKV
jgi:predicted DNA-binding helix-hairpin-helix protein